MTARRIRHQLPLCTAVALLGVYSAGGVPATPVAAAAASARVCDRAAGPRGHDAARGTLRQPFATVRRLVASLRAGQTGCVLGGRYDGNIVFSRGGTTGRPITLQPAPGASVQINGTLDWEPGGSHWRFTGFKVDGASSSGQTVGIYADDVKIDHNDITNDSQGGNCIIDGYLQDGNTVTHGTVIDHNSIHDCGTPGNVLDHGIYVCCGYGTRVTNNTVWNPAGFGIQLYPDADGTVVDHNVIDGAQTKAGVLFGGDAYGRCYATDRATVSNNILVHNGSYGIDDWWGCDVGTGNIARHNCLWGNRAGAVNPDERGVALLGSVLANPGFLARQRHDYRVRRGSPCARMAPRGHAGP